MVVVWDLQADDFSSRENAEESAFLQLPSEIRNTIYEYALGGCTLHITQHKPPGATEFRPRVTICREGEWSTTESGHRAFDRGSFHHGFCESHRDSNLANLDIALLRCSRQIYAEAALIPYSANTFHFLTLDHTEELFKSLMPTQRRAIKSLLFSEEITTYPRSNFDAKRLKGFTDLDDLTINIYHSTYHRAFKIEDLKPFEDEYKDISPDVLPTKVQIHIYGSKAHKPEELQKKATEMKAIILDGPGRAKYQEEERIKAKQAREASKEEEKQALERKKRKRDKDRSDAAIARDTKRQARGLRSLL